MHCTNIRISTGTLRRVFRILTEPVPNTFVSVNRRNSEAPARVAVSARASLFRRFTEPRIYGYFYSVAMRRCRGGARTLGVRRGWRRSVSEATV